MGRSAFRVLLTSHESKLAVTRALKENHVKWHAFLNDLGFHNHMSHHLLAVFALSGGEPLIQAIYERHAVAMRPAFASPELANGENFGDHLGKTDFYDSYLEFFAGLLREKSVPEVLEEYVFSARANVESSAGGKAQGMLVRLMAGLVHPFIHAGYGLEFGVPGLIAEGLAQAAVHPLDGALLTPASLFEGDGETGVARLVGELPKLALKETKAPGADQGPGNADVHALSILARILHDPRFAPSSFSVQGIKDPRVVVEIILAAVGESVVQCSQEWLPDGTDSTDFPRKIEELVWVNVMFYGIGGWAGREASIMNADFFLMHLITSLLFVPSYVAQLSHRSRIILLRSYFATCVAWYVARGRPALPIRVFYAAVTPTPVEHGAPHATPAKGTLVPENPSPNPWLPLLQSAMVHPDDHLCKLQRALVHFAALYGARPAGHFAAFASSAPALEGAEALDGTLFVRVAGLTADRLGWMREGQDDMGWDRRGFFF